MALKLVFLQKNDTEVLSQKVVTSFIDGPFQFQGEEKSWNESFFQQLGLLQDLGQNDFEKIGSTILRSFALFYFSIQNFNKQ